jgi:hypothetical protein
MMFQIGGREEATDLAWRLPRRQLRSWPPWLEGVCSVANLPNKTQITTTHNVCGHVVTAEHQHNSVVINWCLLSYAI